MYYFILLFFFFLKFCLYYKNFFLIYEEKEKKKKNFLKIFFILFEFTFNYLFRVYEEGLLPKLVDKLKINNKQLKSFELEKINKKIKLK